MTKFGVALIINVDLCVDLTLYDFNAERHVRL